MKNRTPTGGGLWRYTYVLNSSFSTGPNRSRLTFASAGRLGEDAAPPTARAADRTGDRMRQNSDSSDGFSTRALMMLMWIALLSPSLGLNVCICARIVDAHYLTHVVRRMRAYLQTVTHTRAHADCTQEIKIFLF